MPYLTFTPPSGSVPRLTKSPVCGSIELYWMAVNDGRISRLRLVDRSVIPSSTPHLRHEALDVARHRRPDHVLLVLALDLAHELEAPAVLHAGGPLRIPEALERDGHLRRVAILDDLRPAVEQRLPGPVGDGNRTPPRLAGVDDAVALHVVAVEVEVVADLLIHERVEVDRHQVVLPRRVAIHPVRPHDARVGVVQVEAEVDVVAVVGDVDLGLLRRRGAVERRLLHELREHCRRAPHLVVETAVESLAACRSAAPGRRGRPVRILRSPPPVDRRRWCRPRAAGRARGCPSGTRHRIARGGPPAPGDRRHRASASIVRDRGMDSTP